MCSLSISTCILSRIWYHRTHLQGVLFLSLCIYVCSLFVDMCSLDIYTTCILSRIWSHRTHLQGVLFLSPCIYVCSLYVYMCSFDIYMYSLAYLIPPDVPTRCSLSLSVSLSLSLSLSSLYVCSRFLSLCVFSLVSDTTGRSYMVFSFLYKCILSIHVYMCVL